MVPNIDWQTSVESDTVRLYRHVGVALQHDSTVQNLRRLLVDARNSTMFTLDAPKPYFVIVAPSGTGKTQLPFTLSADGSLKVFHLVQLEAYGIGAQPIYTYFRPQSTAFDKALRFDLQQYNIQLEIPSCAAVSMMSEPF